MTKRKSLAEAFASKYIRGSRTQCWLWTGSTDYRYGHLFNGGREHKAHRVSYELHLGKIPRGMSVLHKCDTPKCVNPSHLFLGTQSDNNKDRAKKRRSAVGERHARSRFTEKQIRAIRSDPRHASEIGRAYNALESTIYNIKSKRTWAWLK